MRLPLIKEEYQEAMYQFFGDKVQNSLYRIFEAVGRAQEPLVSGNYSTLRFRPPLLDMYYASLMYEVIYKMSTAYRNNLKYSLLEKGDYVGKFSYDQLQGTDVFNYVPITHPIRRFLQFLTDEEAPFEYEVTTHFVVTPSDINRNPILRQHALGNALEINMLQPRTGVKFGQWIRKKTKENKELREDMLLLYAEERDYFRIVGQIDEFKIGKLSKRLQTIRVRSYRGESIKSWIKPTI